MTDPVGSRCSACGARMELTDASLNDSAMHRGQSEVWECPNGHIQASAAAMTRMEFTAGGGPAGVREPRRPPPSASGSSERLLVEMIDSPGTIGRVAAALDAAGVGIRDLQIDTADERMTIHLDLGEHADIGERVLLSVDPNWVVRRETP